MKKIIAKTIIGTEFIYSKLNCFSVPAASCEKICVALNNYKWNISNNELWKVYDISDFDIRYTNAAFQKLMIRKGKIRVINLSTYLGF